MPTNHPQLQLPPLGNLPPHTNHPPSANPHRPPNPLSPLPLPAATHLARLRSANNHSSQHSVQPSLLLLVDSVLMRIRLRAHLPLSLRTRIGLPKLVDSQLLPGHRARSVLVLQMPRPRDSVQVMPSTTVEEQVHLVPLRLYSVNLHLQHYKTNLPTPLVNNRASSASRQVTHNRLLANRQVIRNRLLANRRTRRHRCSVRYQLNHGLAMVLPRLTIHNRQRLRLYLTLLTRSMHRRSTHSRV